MALEDYRSVMERCSRCSYCKWIPFAHVKSWRFAKGCPSVEFNKFQSFSASGRLAASLSLLEGRSDYTEGLQKIAYSCLLDGACDVSCKICRNNMEPVEAMRELRINLVENGQVPLEHLVTIENLRKEDNMMMAPKADRGKWAEGLDVKNLTVDKADVVFHAGCRFSFDQEQWKVPRAVIKLLRKVGIDVGIFEKEENCCGGRVLDLGFKG
jgi:Fe-S oxidoreductase